MPHNDRPTHTSIDETIKKLIHLGRAEEAVEHLFHHPDEKLARTFIAATAEIDANGLKRAYTCTKRTLIRHLQSGRIRDLDHVRQFAPGVIRMIGFHYRCLTRRKENPVLKCSGKTGNRTNPRPLFVRGLDLNAFPARARETEPTGLAPVVLPAARVVGSLHIRVAHLYGRYADACGTTRGAYAYIAQRAELDSRGKVVSVRPWRAAPISTSRPEKHVIRRVRDLYLDACERIRVEALRLGYMVPPV